MLFRMIGTITVLLAVAAAYTFATNDESQSAPIAEQSSQPAGQATGIDFSKLSTETK